ERAGLVLLEDVLAVEVHLGLIIAASLELEAIHVRIGDDVAHRVAGAVFGLFAEVIIEVEEVILGLVLLPFQFFVADFLLVSGLGLEVGLAGDLLLDNGVGATGVFAQGDGGQQQPGRDETFVVGAALVVGGAGAA